MLYPDKIQGKMRKNPFKLMKYLLKLSSILGILLLWCMPVSILAQPMTVNDTTRVDCGTTAAYNLWIDNKQLALSFQFLGSRLEATPPITTNFSFDTPCNDTVTHLLELFDGTNTLLYSEQAVLIVLDEEAPIFTSSLADTVYLSCEDVIPDSSSVTRSDNCQIDQFTYLEQSSSVGNCPVADTIRRNWTAVDLCGNQASYQQTIIISDDQRPVFLDLPPLNDTVGCLADAHPDFTGYPRAEDNCDTDVQIEFFDQLSNESQLPGCQHQQRIVRIWTIRDDCSNTNTYVQTIRVLDTIPPSFIPPRDTIINCEFGDDPFFTGFPILEQTDCDSLTENNYRFEDQIIASDCDNNYQVLRKWFVFDNCGNVDSVEQNIQVIDTVPPAFQREAQDLILNCPAGQLLDTVYQNWINDNGLASAVDNCNIEADITWQAVISGTSTTASFPTRSCQDGNQIILEQTVDFIATDLCGNRDTTTASFRVIDDIAPQILACPADTSIFTRTDACAGTYRLARPAVQDECSADGTNFPGLTIEYKVGSGTYLPLSGAFVDIDIPLGQQLVTYRITDCGGNQDSCSFQVTVLDNVPPQITCPNDTLLAVGPNDCQVALQLPLPQATDNCSLETTFEGPRPIYFASGATVIIPTKMDAGPPPTEQFNLGETIVSYVIRDQAGNTDTCTFLVNVVDNIAPIANCQPTTIFINPSGLDNQQVPVGDVNNNSMDNCAIDTMFLSPNVFSCEAQVGGVEDVILTVIDASNNISRCTTFVRIENLEPQPSANSGLCGNDTLFLNANPPPADGGTVYTYQWTGPNGFTSTRANPSIPNIREINAGSYTVEITGLTGCTSFGSVEVTIEDLPQTPTLLAEDNYCINSFVNLQSSIAPDGAQVIFRWYRGTPPGGVLIAETIVPSFSFQAASVQSSDEYYVVIEADGCVSQPSLPKRITVNDFPVAIPEDTTITVCSGESIKLGTQVIGTGISYQWTGPNGYNETGQFPRIIESANTSNDGIYSLVVSRNGCPSNPAFVRVNVLQSPGQPMLSNNGPVCEEESITLSTNAQASIYHWIAPDLTEFSTTTSTFVLNNVSRNVNGEWRLYVTDFSCDSPTSVPSLVVVNDLPNAVAASSPDIVCEGGDLQLNASPNIADATYAWSGPDNFSGVGRNVNISNVRPAKSGNYEVTITTTEGCSNSADINVNVQESVRIIAATNDGAACLSGATDIRLNAAVFPADDGGYSYDWTGPNNYIANIKEAVIPNATAANNGNYQLIVTNAQGCISQAAITTVDVSDPPPRPAKPLVSDITPMPFCVGAPIRLLVNDYIGTTVNYNWQTPNDGLITTTVPFLEVGQADLDDAGDYSIFVTVDGCSSNASEVIRLGVNPRPVASISNNSPVCAGERINLNANFIAGAEYNWVGPNFSSSLQNPAIMEADTALHRGFYELVIEQNGCESEKVTTFVGINPTPSAPQLIGNSPLCADEPDARLRLNLNTNTVTNNAMYIWSGPNGILDTTSIPSFDITTFENFPDGNNDFSVKALLGVCSSEDSQAFTAVINKIPDGQAFAGQDFSICETEDITLRGESPLLGTGRWSLSSLDTNGLVSITNPSLPITNVNGLVGGQSYLFRWSLSNGACEQYAFDEVEISVNKVEDAVAGEDQIACAGSTINLRADSVTSNSFWTQPEAQSLFGVQIQDPRDPTSAITGLQPGNLYSFTWNVQGSCGDERDDVLVLISDPNPFAGADIVVCNEEGFAQLNADEPTDGSIGTWYALQAGVQISADQSPTATVTNLQPGIFQFVWEVDNGTCGEDSRDTLQVAYKRNPLVRPESFTVNYGEPLDIDLTQNDDLPSGSFLNIIQNPNNGTVEELGFGRFRFQPSFNYVGEDRLLYEVCSEACECMMGEATFVIGQDAACEIPTIITPNNDGVNDEFIIPCLFDPIRYPNSQLTVVSQWGDEVYRSNKPYTNDWRGTFNGEDLPVGTYFYIVDFGNGAPPQSSFFMIQR